MADTFWKNGDITWKNDDVVWAGAIFLTVADSTHAQSVDAVAVTQNHNLTVADSTHAVGSDVPEIILCIIADDSTHGVSSDNAVLTQVHALTVNDSTHGISSDSVTIVVDLIIADSTNAISSDNVAITQAHTLVTADSSHSHTVDAVVITQIHNLTVSDTLHAHSVGVVSLGQYRTYAVDGIQSGLVQEIKNLIQDTTYSYADILGWLNDAQFFVSGGVLLVYPDRTQVFSSPLEGLETNDTVTASTTAAYVALPSDYQRSLLYVYNETADCYVYLSEAFGEMLNESSSLDDDGHVTEVVIEGKRLYYQGVPEEDETLRLYYYRKPFDMATYTSSGISFSGTTIADSNNGLGVFYAGQVMDLTGSYLNAGEHTIVSVEDDGSEMVVSATLTAESAGRSITIRSRPEIPEHLQKSVLVNRVLTKYLQIKQSELSAEYNDRFYMAMIDLETDRENANVPQLWRAA